MNLRAASSKLRCAPNSTIPVFPQFRGPYRRVGLGFTRLGRLSRTTPVAQSLSLGRARVRFFPHDVRIRHESIGKQSAREEKT
jgi:hypothetical protein